MLIWKKVYKRINEVDDIICNRCKGSCMINGEHYGLSANVRGGYYSIHLTDDAHYSFDLCEKCLSELFAEFKINPEAELL